METVTLPVKVAQLAGTAVSSSDFPDNHAWIDYLGPPGTFPTYSLSSVLDGHVNGGVFAHKIVLIGITDPSASQRDTFLTSVSSTPMSGVEVDANAVWTILHGFPLQPVSGAVNLLLIIVLATLPALLAVRFATLNVLLISAAILVLFLLLAQLAFNAGWIIDVPNPVLALVLGCAGAITVESYVERRHRHMLDAALGPGRGDGADFFISYRRELSRWPARILNNALARRFGPPSVFMDRDAIEVGAKWPERIREAAEACHVMLVLVGPRWAEVRDREETLRLADPGDWVRLEVETGLQREDEIVVVPVLHDGAELPAAEDLPESLRRLLECNAVTLPGDDPESEVEALVNSIQKGRMREYFRRERRKAAT